MYMCSYVYLSNVRLSARSFLLSPRGTTNKNTSTSLIIAKERGEEKPGKKNKNVALLASVPVLA